jgi:hypothetical protein
MTDERQKRVPRADDSHDATGPPAITQSERDRSGPLGPKDTDAGPEGDYPDPDDYAGADDH